MVDEKKEDIDKIVYGYLGIDLNKSDKGEVHEISTLQLKEAMSKAYITGYTKHSQG